MKVADFKDFVRLGALAELDLGSAQLGFQSEPRLHVWYQAPHKGGITVAGPEVAIEGLPGGGDSLAVDAAHLSKILRLLPDEETLQVKVVPPNMTFVVKGARFSLRANMGSMPPEIKGRGERRFTVSGEGLELLNRALSLLDGITGKQSMRPVLGGTQVSVERGNLILKATDNIRGAVLSIPVDGDDGEYGVIPVADWRVATTLCGSDKLEVRKHHEERVDLTSGRTRIRLVLYPAGDFPDLSVLPTKFSSTVELSSQAIAIAAKAAAVLDDARVVTVKTQRDRLLFMVESHEVGSFQTLGGKGELGFEVVFDGGHLEGIEALGSTVKLHVNNARSAVMAEGEHGWRYWIAPIIVDARTAQTFMS